MEQKQTLERSKAQGESWALNRIMENQYIKSGPAAKAIGVTSHTLKNWEKLFNWDVPRDERGHRLYSPSVITHGKAINAQMNAGKGMAEIMGHEKAPQVHPDYKKPEPVGYGIEY